MSIQTSLLFKKMHFFGNGSYLKLAKSYIAAYLDKTSVEVD